MDYKQSGRMVTIGRMTARLISLKESTQPTPTSYQPTLQMDVSKAMTSLDCSAASKSTHNVPLAQIILAAAFILHPKTLHHMVTDSMPPMEVFMPCNGIMCIFAFGTSLAGRSREISRPSSPILTHGDSRLLFSVDRNARLTTTLST